jgi:hypothetical protein
MKLFCDCPAIAMGFARQPKIKLKDFPLSVICC